VQPYAPKDEIRPLFVNLNAQTTRSGRSPLISLMFPTIKDKLTNLSKSRAANIQKTANTARPTFLEGSELERLVKLEMSRRSEFI
jgi:hypothetical protein